MYYKQKEDRTLLHKDFLGIVKLLSAMYFVTREMLDH